MAVYHRRSDLWSTELHLATLLEAGKSKDRTLAPAEDVAWWSVKTNRGVSELACVLKGY